MKKIITLTVIVAMLSTILIAKKNSKEGKMEQKSIYDFTVKSIDGKDVKMSDYKGKVLLIVNVASKCGFTPQYKGLEELYRKYQKDGLVVMGFPCNQFAGQEPGSNEEIKTFCKTNYDVTFPMFDKIDVNGDNTAPLYQFLKEQAPGILSTKDIKWNFTKFLIDKNGKVIERFAPATTPESIDEHIARLLKK